MFRADNYLAYITGKLGKVMAHAFEKRIEPYPVTRVQWTTLHYIQKHAGLTQKELAEYMEAKESYIVKILDEMEEYGYLKRSISRKDRRVKTLNLTEKGEEIYGQMQPAVNSFVKSSFHNVSEEEMKTFYRVLCRVIENN